MPKPLSRPHELGRAVGYKIDAGLLLERFKNVPARQQSDLQIDRTFVEQVGRAVGVAHKGTNRGKEKRLWLVVKIENDVPVMIDAYADKRSAGRREKFLRQHMRRERDAVTIFPINLKLTI